MTIKGKKHVNDFIKNITAHLQEGHVLSKKEACTMFEHIMSGDANDAQIGAILAMMSFRGEHAYEVESAARIMRQKAKPFKAPPHAMDIVGTGGDKLDTLNISTATSFVVAGAGVKVAKHGNKSITSLSGTADVQTALGINITASTSLMEKALECANIGFMMAPLYHSAMKHVVAARTSLKFKTIFNILGPLTNPAAVQYYLIGCFSKQWMHNMATSLNNMDTKKAWIVHSEEGMDEISGSSPTFVLKLENGDICETVFTPEEFGLRRHTIDDIKGKDAAYNAEVIKDLLKNNTKSAFYDVVLLNSAAALNVAGLADTMEQGLEIAAESLSEQKAFHCLQKLISITHEKET